MTVDILAFGPHPDDVELAAGGTLIRAARSGSRTAIVTLTKGEMGTRGTVEGRAAEFSAAAAVMGLSAHRMLALPDGRLSDTPEAREAVVREIRDLRPSVVLLPWPEDRHPDHSAASLIVQSAAFLSGLRKLETGQEPHRPAELVYYTHTWELPQGPGFVVDVSDFMEEKVKAMRCYGSQVWDASRPDGGEKTFISSESFWELLMARAAHLGRLIGKRYAEGFRIRGLIEVKDLVEAFGGRSL